MESKAIFLSPSSSSYSFPKTRNVLLNRNHNPNLKLGLGSSSLSVNGGSVVQSCSTNSLGLSSVSHFDSSIVRPIERKYDFRVRVSKAFESHEERSEAKGGSIGKTLELGILIGLWYISNIYFNIYNKQVLKVYPFPLTVSAIQFFIGTVLIFTMWALNLYKRPKISTSQILAIAPLAIVHTVGNLSLNMSLGKVSVSFTHTIKALEPFFSVFLSALFLGQIPSIWVVSSLLPVVGGVALASLTEVSFNWIGFWSAMLSNLANQSRNVFSKMIMLKKEETLDNITLFSIITIISFLLNIPLAVSLEGVKFTPSYLQSSGVNVSDLCVKCLLAGICFQAYQQLGYMVLQRLSPVSHSVSNCVKRVVVIVSSVIFFQTPVTAINSIGTGIALTGVLLYSRVTQKKPKSD